MLKDKSKVAIVGAGNVGSTFQEERLLKHSAGVLKEIISKLKI